MDKTMEYLHTGMELVVQAMGNALAEKEPTKTIARLAESLSRLGEAANSIGNNGVLMESIQQTVSALKEQKDHKPDDRFVFGFCDPK